MKTTFLNGDKELKKRGLKYWNFRLNDLTKFMNDPEYSDPDIGNFYDYGLSIDYVAPGTFDNRRGYLRYQFSWGGSSDEIRFYNQNRIEYVFLDWFVGVGFDITNTDVAQWLYEYFDEIGILQSEKEKAIEE